jgi:flagellar hook-associated protein 2
MVESTSSSTSTNTANTSTARPKVDGLVSGIQSSTIIDAFINAERATTRLLETNKARYEARREATRTFNTKLLSAQLDLSALKNPSTFQSRSATSSDTDALTIANTGVTALPGNYTLDVLAIARSHQRATTGQVSAEASFGIGTISLQVGSKPATVIDFSSGGSLNDIATAINNSNSGISASIVNDGTASPYRLVLQAKETGAANTIIATGTGGMTSLMSGMTTLTAASDAQVRIGSGGTPITVTQASNTFTNVVPGVSLDVHELKNGLTVNVVADTKPAKDAITSFVTSINAAAAYLKSNSNYDLTTKSAGILISQSSLLTGFSRIMNTVNSAVPGLPQPINSLSAIGISIKKEDGSLVIDNTKLEQVLSSDPEKVRNLFANSGTSSNPAVQFANLTNKTNTTSPFTVAITQPAKQAVLTTTDLAASTIINNSNNTLDITINNRAVSLTLTNGTYSRSDLATHVQSILNGSFTASNEKMTVSLTGNQLDVRTNAYGRNQQIRIGATSTSLTALGLSPETSTGLDVAGTINGVAGTGNGRNLGGAVGGAAEGLSLNITATVPLGSVTVNASKGLGQVLTGQFGSMTDNTSGIISSLDKNLTKNIADAGKSITKSDEALTKRRLRYEQQFQAMEKMIAKFNSQGTTITNFVKALTKSDS